MPVPVSMALAMTKPPKVSQEFVNCLTQNPNAEFTSTSTSTTSSSGKESEGTGKKKRKMADYFESLMKQVLDKQESLQNKFMEAIEKCERDRMAREETWKMQELARKKEEEERVAQERSIAAAKDAALIAFLQKISEQPGLSSLQLPENPIQSEMAIQKQANGIGENVNQISSSRWPKAEVEALIRLRTNLDLQYQDNGPKGPLWEEISSGMKKLGYDRSAKRCKEKWENINKYYKRVRESNKKRPEDSKTCPYFHMLESLTQMKSSKKIDSNSDNSNSNVKPEATILMEMMGQQEHPLEPRSESVTEDGDCENLDQDQVDKGDNDDDDDEEDNGGDYQIVANNTSSVATIE